jgi:hypothetical protein
MSETIFEKEVIKKLIDLEKGIDSVRQEVNLIKERVVDDSILSEDDKKALDSALKEEKEGKLLSKEQVFD